MKGEKEPLYSQITERHLFSVKYTSPKNGCSPNFSATIKETTTKPPTKNEKQRRMCPLNHNVLSTGEGGESYRECEMCKDNYWVDGIWRQKDIIRATILELQMNLKRVKNFIILQLVYQNWLLHCTSPDNILFQIFPGDTGTVC